MSNFERMKSKNCCRVTFSFYFKTENAKDFLDVKKFSCYHVMLISSIFVKYAIMKIGNLEIHHVTVEKDGKGGELYAKELIPGSTIQVRS